MCLSCGNANHIITSLPFGEGQGGVFKAEYKSVGEIISKIWDKIIKPGDVDEGLFLHTGEKLFEGVEKGYGKKILEVDFKTPDFRRLAFMRTNVFVFSAFKTYQTLRAVADVLTETTTKAEFKKAAMAKFDEYDGRYLDAEYNNAIASATSAREWADFEDAKETMPLLKYQTAEDDRVREEHQRLNGIILPVDDSFWNIYMPPNDWGCRCDVLQLAEGTITPKESVPHIEIKPMFKNNTGKTGIIFPDTHPYFDVAKKDVNRAKNLFGLEVPEIKK